MHFLQVSNFLLKRQIEQGRSNLRRNIFSAIYATAGICASCGISNSEYIDYRVEPTATPATECPAALTAFTGNIASAVDGTCAGSSCHGSKRGALGELVSGQNAANRTAMLKYTDPDGTTMFTKISSASHGGKDQSKALPLANIQAWRTAEAACPK
jgi:hypothetical protein